jgi:hypothetical protein
MARKLSLPLPGKLLDLEGPPSVDVMRSRLGGRSPSSPLATGDVVRVGDAEPARLGVVLAGDSESVDVFLAEGTVRRTRAADARPWLGAVPLELGPIASDARAFGALREGQPVRYASVGEPAEPGVLVEKCRWGGLVQRPDGALVGVGFRRIVAAGGADRAS